MERLEDYEHYEEEVLSIHPVKIPEFNITQFLHMSLYQLLSKIRNSYFLSKKDTSRHQITD